MDRNHSGAWLWDLSWLSIKRRTEYWLSLWLRLILKMIGRMWDSWVFIRCLSDGSRSRGPFLVLLHFFSLTTSSSCSWSWSSIECWICAFGVLLRMCLFLLFSSHALSFFLELLCMQYIRKSLLLVAECLSWLTGCDLRLLRETWSWRVMVMLRCLLREFCNLLNKRLHLVSWVDQVHQTSRALCLWNERVFQ